MYILNVSLRVVYHASFNYSHFIDNNRKRVRRVSPQASIDVEESTLTLIFKIMSCRCLELKYLDPPSSDNDIEILEGVNSTKYAVFLFINTILTIYPLHFPVMSMTTTLQSSPSVILITQGYGHLHSKFILALISFLLIQFHFISLEPLH